MTPASVDGGPATLKGCPFCPWPDSAKVQGHPEDDHGGSVVMAEWWVECACGARGPASEDIEDACRYWNDGERPSAPDAARPTTRDAALREEGRAQERDDIGRELGRRIEACFGGPDDGTEETLLAFMGWLVKRAVAATLTPDASQGSAPVDRFADGWRACQEAATEACRGLSPEVQRNDFDRGRSAAVFACAYAIGTTNPPSAPPAAPQGSPLPGDSRQEAIEAAAIELWREWERQARRFYEVMGEDNPRLEAIAARVDALAIAFGPPGSGMARR